MEEAVDMISRVNINTHSFTAWDSQEAEEVGVLLDMILNIKNDGDRISVPEHMKVAEVNQDCESSLKLVSALKGGREQRGLPPKAKTNVKWAADVYEPPTTSMSHTVKSSRQYYRSTRRKDNHKHKHKKGSKSTRGGSGDKKRLGSQKGVSGSDNLRQRVQASPAQLPIAGVELPVTGNQESKCGSSSFLMSPLAKVHYSVAEA
ncbi:hypothetical protein H6P81_006521 [Aristolochia fimbriata]|uniref:Uncharacterized protein n=1 Tax=Aristolochia fimbriata TaxID=158543 RepID=A0AAV7F1F1_ARIFI|nr:hypothetical protein H6P81_006521 [Aristolochia fimbriata]